MKTKVIITENELVKQVDTLSIEGKLLRVYTQMFERDSKKENWWESCASSTTLPIKAVKELLRVKA